MVRDGIRGVSRRTTLKLAGGAVAGVGGLDSATLPASADCENDTRTQYVVYVLITAGGKNGDSDLPRRYASEATEQLNRELDYGGELRYVQRGLNPDEISVDLSRFSPSVDQETVFEDLIAALPDSEYLDRVREEQIDADDVRLDDMHFVIAHDIASASMSGEQGVGNVIGEGGSFIGGSMTGGRPGWSLETPVAHTTVAGERMDAVMIGPRMALDAAGLNRELTSEDGTWKTRVMAYQAVGHALGARHRHGGYRVDDGAITSVSPMAAGHVLDATGRYDLVNGILDNGPWVDPDLLVYGDDGRLETTDDGRLIVQPGDGERDTITVPDSADFDGWNGNPFPATEARLPADRPRNGFESLHTLSFTSRAKTAMARTLRGGAAVTGQDTKVQPSIDVPDTLNAGTGEALTLDASGTVLPRDPAATVYEWRVWPKGAPRGKENGFWNVAHAYGQVTEVPYEELERRFMDPGEELIAQLNVFVVPGGESFGGYEGDGSLRGTLRQLVERNPRRGGAREIPGSGCRTDEWANVLFNRTQSEPITVVERTPPQPEITVADEPTTAEPVTFDASGSFDPDGDALIFYEWTFTGPTDRLRAGDDGPVTTRTVTVPDPEIDAPTGTFESVEHSFERPGRYDVTLTLGNTRGERNETTETIAVVDPDQPVARIEGTEPIEPGATARFVAVTENAPEGADVVYDWSVTREADDWQATDSGRTLEFTPSTVGHYEITLDATFREAATMAGTGGYLGTDEGRLFRTVGTATASRSVVANEAPTVAIRADREQIPPGTTATFEAVVVDADPGDSYEYEWLQPFELRGQGRETSGQFGTIGDREVRVRVTDSFGESTVTSTTVEVEDPAEEPEVLIRGPDAPEAGHEAKYTARVTGGEPPLDYDWNLPSGNGAFAFPTFDDPGPETIRLTVTDDRGYDASAAKTVQVAQRESRSPRGAEILDPGSPTGSDFSNGTVGLDFEPRLSYSYVDAFRREGRAYTREARYIPRDGTNAPNKFEKDRFLEVTTTDRGYVIDRRYARGSELLDVTAEVRIPPEGQVVLAELVYENAGSATFTVTAPSFFIADGTPIGKASLASPTGSYRMAVSGHGVTPFADVGYWTEHYPTGVVPHVTAFDDRDALTVGLLSGTTGLEQAFVNRESDMIRLQGSSATLGPGDSVNWRLGYGLHDGGANDAVTSTAADRMATAKDNEGLL